MKNSYKLFSVHGGLALLLVLFFTLTTQAQVGIGNTNPDTSSMLDITSTSKGLLVPRMTSVQRLAITTPANSLLVYDTTIKAYYYYDTVSLTWIKINSALNQRNNYVLVKTAADLPAPSGGKITLVSNTLYEINGLITITAPIDLNDAYVAGLDANEDVISFPGGVVFKGNTGGSIRNVTLKGAKAFEITGPGIATATSLLVQNTIVDGMTTSVGSISGIGLYFGNVVQFINNKGGITYTNIGNLLLNNQAWFATNEVVFETFTGTFGLIEKVSGFSSVDASDVAIDVSSNPAVGNGVIQGTVFSGTTTEPNGYIRKYTTGSYPGYNFTNNWTINSPGITRESDDVATGNIILQTNAANTFSTGVPKKLAVTTASSNLFRFTKDGDNRITYRGEKKRFFQIFGSSSFSATDDSFGLIVYIAKGSGAGPSTVVNETRVYGKGASALFSDGGLLSLPIAASIELKKNDYIEIWVERFTGTGNLNTLSLNVTVQ